MLGLIAFVSIVYLALVQFSKDIWQIILEKIVGFDAYVWSCSLVHILRGCSKPALHLDWSGCSEPFPSLPTSFASYDRGLTFSCIHTSLGEQ